MAQSELQEGAGGFASEFDGPRGCGPYELAPTLDLINWVFRGERPAPDRAPGRVTMGWDYAHIYHPQNLDNVRIVQHRASGQIVSSVGIYETRVRTPRGQVAVGGINAVATHPEFRRRGLSTATLEDALAKMRADGLHVGLLGTGIPHFYRRLGWERAGMQPVFALDRGNVSFLPDPEQSGLEVTEDWRPCAAELAAMHNAESLGASRTPGSFVLLAERRLDRVVVARRGGVPVAYAGLWRDQVREYGGETETVAALLRAVFNALDDPSLSSTERLPDQRHAFELTVWTPPVAPAACDDGLPQRLAGIGLPVRITYQGMLKILDPPALFAALDLADVDLEAGDGAWRLHHRGRTLGLPERALVKLVFGPERYAGFAPHFFPVPFYQWPAERV
ncbi:MAG TPA: GNAT family N-acetyltransferase [Chloroflexota bacterium]|nr:GNAT family N-acetyltransferase [Chloroflexota bacterium]